MARDEFVANIRLTLDWGWLSHQLNDSFVNSADGIERCCLIGVIARAIHLQRISRACVFLSLSLSLSSFIFDEQEISKPARRLSPCYTPKAYGEIAARVSPIDAGICNRDAQTFM